MSDLFKLGTYSKIGIVVKNVEEAVEHYEKAFGWGPWQVNERIDLSDALYKGVRSGCVLKNAVFPDPSVKMDEDYQLVELIEPLEGESPFKDYLEAHGNGIMCVQIMVDDLDEAVKELEANGCEKAFWGNMNVGIPLKVAFMKSPLLGNLQFELIAFDFDADK